jgi:hypothetical protein
MKRRILNKSVSKKRLPTALKIGPGRFRGKIKALNTSPNMKIIVINAISQMF